MVQNQIKPYLTHLHESHRYTSALLYLLLAGNVAEDQPKSSFGVRHQKFSDDLKDSYGSPVGYFMAQLFVSRMAAFEVFLQETVSLVIQKNPKKVGSVEFKLSDVLDLSESQLIQRAAEEQLNKLMYKKPAEYLSAICEILSIEKEALEFDWPVFIEAKARRDLGMHNAWKCNAIYLKKLAEANIQPQIKVGESALPKDEKYISVVDDTLDRLAKIITKQVFVKHWPEYVSKLPASIR